MNYKLIRSFTFFWVILIVGLCESMPVAAAVLARGDGFVIESSDIDAQKSFFSAKGFESTEAEYLNSVLKERLFILEAKNIGLIDSLPEPTGPYQNEMAKEYHRLFLIYYQHLMETYPVSEDAIQSYYLSYPEKFLLNDKGPKENIKNQDLWALDDEIKVWIKSQIVISKQPVIVANEFDRLKTKYHVVIEN